MCYGSLAHLELYAGSDLALPSNLFIYRETFSIYYIENKLFIIIIIDS